MRKIPPMVQLSNGSYLDSFSLAITKVDDPIAYESLVREEDKGYRFGQYLTAQDFSTRYGRQFVFSGRDIETLGPVRLRQALSDRTVIIGRQYKEFSNSFGEDLDMHNSPGGVQPGAMLHANFIEAMRDPNSTFTPISDRAAEILEWGLAFSLALLGALEIHAGWKWGGLVVSGLISVLMCYVLLQNLGFFLDFFIPLLMIVVHTIAEELLEMRRELHRAKLQLREKKNEHS
jgi:hypothetical protein